MNKFRYLTTEEVEARVSTVSDKGISLLLYKDARCDMRILDETVGAENWQREHYECKGNLFCRVGIKSESGEWVWKSDCGTESRTEAEKGEASDSFKRACFNWGIGRELYTAPFVWVPRADKNGSENYKVNAKGQPTTRFRVTYMRVENGKIVALNVESTRPSKTVYTFGNCFPDSQQASKQPTAPAAMPAPKKVTAPQVEELLKLCSKAGWQPAGMLKYLQEKYPDAAPQKLEEITYSEYSVLATMLTNRIKKAAANGA